MFIIVNLLVSDNVLNFFGRIIIMTQDNLYLTICIPTILFGILNLKTNKTDLKKLYIIAFVLITLISFLFDLLTTLLVHFSDNLISVLLLMSIGALHVNYGFYFKILLSFIIDIIIIINIFYKKNEDSR